MMKYEIISNNVGLDQLVKDVNKKITLGYVPVGSVQVVPIEKTGGLARPQKGPTYHYLQAVYSPNK